ncbi:MAG: TRAP transporter large permease subunit [Betaproteobacteria bacterium]|nr:TRAP transporter large permease subunit [Betaproteobacteria bacterium]
MFAALCVLIMSGVPMVFVLAGTAILFAVLGAVFGGFDLPLLGALIPRVFSVMTSETLVAIPLFVFMGLMLERSKIAEELLEAMGSLFGRVRGGLAVSVSVVGMLLAASTGIVGATTVTMGLMALPVMLRRGYNPSFACGSICAAGTLGQIIPPSTVMVVMGEVLSAAYQQAQFAQGKFSVETVSVGQLFAGSLFPGLMLVGLYIVYQLVYSLLRPQAAPALPRGADAGPRPGARELFRALVPPLVLIGAVLGSILGGVATPTEAAAVGAVGATLLAAKRVASGRPWAVWTVAIASAVLLALATSFDLRLGRDSVAIADGVAIGIATLFALLLIVGLAVALLDLGRSGVLGAAAGATMSINAMVFAIVIGASLFSLVFIGLGGEARVERLLEDLPGGTTGALIAVMFIIFVLGLWLDYVEISIIVIPVVGPFLMKAGVDPIWFGVMVALNMQTSFLSPPVGYTLSYLRAVAPPSVTTGMIWRGVVPFMGLQILAMGILALWPGLATWLPRLLFSK